jgi:hypothetical protein
MLLNPMSKIDLSTHSTVIIPIVSKIARHSEVPNDYHTYSRLPRQEMKPVSPISGEPSNIQLLLKPKTLHNPKFVPREIKPLQTNALPITFSPEKMTRRKEFRIKLNRFNKDQPRNLVLPDKQENAYASVINP